MYLQYLKPTLPYPFEMAALQRLCWLQPVFTNKVFLDVTDVSVLGCILVETQAMANGLSSFGNHLFNQC